MLGAQDGLSPRQTFLLQTNVTDSARSCARIYRTPGKLSGTERDATTPRDASFSKTNSILSLQIPSVVVTFVSPSQFKDQDIVSPRHSGSIVKSYRSSEPFDAHIDGSPAKNSDYTRFFSHSVGLEAVYREVAYVDASERMNFASNPVLSETPKFVNLRILIVNTVDKLNSIFAPVTKSEGMTDHSNWFASRHRIP